MDSERSLGDGGLYLIEEQNATNVLNLWKQLIPIMIFCLVPNFLEFEAFTTSRSGGVPCFHKASRERRFDKYIHYVILRGALRRDHSLSRLEVTLQATNPIPEYDNTTPSFYG